MYDIQVSVHLNSAAPMIFCVRRRFNHWVSLHEGTGTPFSNLVNNIKPELLERNPTLNEKVPPKFPSRTLVKASVETIHSRADYFHKYLYVLNRDPQLANAPPVLSFLELNSIVQSLSVVCIQFLFVW
jgi:hypothetical protein